MSRSYISYSFLSGTPKECGRCSFQYNYMFYIDKWVCSKCILPSDWSDKSIYIMWMFADSQFEEFNIVISHTLINSLIPGNSREIIVRELAQFAKTKI